VSLENELVEVLYTEFAEVTEDIGLDQVFLGLGRFLSPVRLFERNETVVNKPS